DPDDPPSQATSGRASGCSEDDSGRGRNSAATRPPAPATVSATSARPYARLGVLAMPATRMVPAIAVPSDEPRLETLRDSPEISPWRSSGKLDCTTFTDGVSIVPLPRPISNSPGTNVATPDVSLPSASKSAMPASVTTNPG